MLTYSESSKANVKYIVDANGDGWLCDAGVSEHDNLRGQNCVSADEWHYDRMFGG